MKAILALEDGSVFHGQGFGAPASACGEVCFNTSMTGYQEILTDPSYKGQIVTMTYPLIGNYGVNREDVESWKPHVSGFAELFTQSAGKQLMLGIRQVPFGLSQRSERILKDRHLTISTTV